MKEEILSQIRSFVFPDVQKKISGLLDQYRHNCMAEASDNERTELLRDQIEHLMRALEMISKVPETSEGATMARGIADEAMSVVSTKQ
jgi:hypothetical protein